MNLKGKFKRNKGITLIALVITIIVLLILAGVTINVLFGDNGILNKAQNAKDANIISQEKEYIRLAWNNAYLKKALETEKVTITASDMDEEMDGYGADAEQSGTSEIKIKYRDTKNVYYVSGKGKTVSILTEEEKNIKAEEKKYGKYDPTPGVIDKEDDGETQLDGTYADPYRIQSIEDLLAFAYNVNTGINTYAGKVIELNRNLDFNDVDSYVDATALYSCNENGYTTEGGDTAVKELLAENGFIPIGIKIGSGKTFTGAIVGEKHYLSNLLIKESSNSIQGYGLFGCVEDDILIANLEIKSGSITGKGSTAGFIGKAINMSTEPKKIMIYRCYNRANVVSTTHASAGFIGEVTYNYSTKGNFNLDIQDSYNYGDIEGKNSSGGILGYYFFKNTKEEAKVYIKSCENSGEIISSSYSGGIVAGVIDEGSGGLANIELIYDRNTGNVISSGQYAGGILGCKLCSNASNIITKCYNKGDVTTSSGYVGGIVGNASTTSTINNCYNTGNVTTSSGYVGGILGFTYSSTIINCFNIGEVKSETNPAGGIIGITTQSSTITNCYNEGNITSLSSSQAVTGGILGRVAGGTSTINNCYNTGDITAYVYSGGILGYAEGTGIINNCYNTGNIASTGAPVGGIVGNASTTSTINNCYNTGNITGSANMAGGISGCGLKGSEVTNCYYLSGTAKFLVVYNDGLGEKEEAEMKTTEFLNLLKAGNEESLWKIDSRKNNGMPTLDIIKKINSGIICDET